MLNGASLEAIIPDISDMMDLERYAPPVPSARIQSVTKPTAAGKPPSTVLAYWRLQNGSARSWVAVGALQNLRYMPEYAIPLITGWLIDHINPADSSRVLDPLPLALAATMAMCAGNVVSTTAARVILSRINRTLAAGLRRSLIRRINRLAFAFHDRAQQGALQNKFTLDMGRLEGFQNFISESILMYGTTTVVMLVIIAWYNSLLLAVIALTLPLNWVCG